MRRRRILVMLVAAALVALGVGVGSADQPDTSVRTKGKAQFQPNAHIFSNLQFSPGPIKVASGEVVTWTDEDSVDEPHTVTILDELPQGFEDITGPPPPTIEAAFAGHFPPDAPPVLVLDDDGDGGLDAEGDSLLLLPDSSISAEITAPAGTTLTYLCIIHPWMQGSIDVR